MRYLGVDPGGRKIGFATGDDSSGVVVPLDVVNSSGVASAAEIIADRASHLKVDRVVIGLPTAADGQPTAAGRRSNELAKALLARGLDVALQAEYLTTNEARRRARDAGLPARRPVDHIAAQVLLEEYLAGT